MELPNNPTSYCWSHSQRKLNQVSKRHLCVHVCPHTVYNSQEMDLPKCTSAGECAKNGILIQLYRRMNLFVAASVEVIVLSGPSSTQSEMLHYLTQAKSEKADLMEVKSRMVVTRHWERVEEGKRRGSS